MKILNAGVLDLVKFAGEDIDVVQAARISNGAALPDWRGAPDEHLIDFLAENEHTSPFEHAWFKFYVKAPIFVLREWMRHRTLSYNEMSGRYRKLRPEFWYPENPRIPDPDNKQSSIEVTGDLPLRFITNTHMTEAYEKAWYDYEGMIAQGVAREVARAVLPVGIYSEMIVSGNFLNWWKFYRLRSQPAAQLEIRKYAEAIGDILAYHMPLAFTALRKER